MAEIIVCGYPRSGNVWISRLLGDALDLRVVGLRGGRGSVAAEGFGRTGEGYVMQTHRWPGDKDKHRRVNLGAHRYQIFLLVVRDPRDVAVSVSHYWDWTLDEVLTRMIDGPGPLELPPWAVFAEAWLREDAPIVRYEDLHRDAESTLARLLARLGLTATKPLAKVVKRQSFTVKRTEIERREDKAFPFGKQAQLQHLRRGGTGEWREAFTEAQAARAFRAWGPVLERMGYDGSE